MLQTKQRTTYKKKTNLAETSRGKSLLMVPSKPSNTIRVVSEMSRDSSKIYIFFHNSYFPESVNPYEKLPKSIPENHGAESIRTAFVPITKNFV